VALLLANDLVIKEDNCNLSCQYCLTGQSNFKAGHEAMQIFRPPRLSSYSHETALGKRIDRVIDLTADEFQLPILKVTGGEIFLIRGIMDLLRHVSKHFATLVIQTNGLLLDSQILSEIKSWHNACLQISLDAISYEGNSYRSESPEQHEKVLSRITLALESGIPTEIYLVLNDRSIPVLDDTLRALKNYEDHISVQPFPVRGPNHDIFSPRRDQVAVLQRITDNYSEYQTILPPKPYMVRLLRFFNEGGRSFRCHLPRLAFTTFDDGILTSCPNIWFNVVGNVLDEDATTVMSRVGKTPFYQILLAEKPRIEACKGCFTPWDLLSMCIDGEITLDELCRTPMYSAPASRARIEQIMNSYREAKC